MRVALMRAHNPSLFYIFAAFVGDSLDLYLWKNKRKKNERHHNPAGSSGHSSAFYRDIAMSPLELQAHLRRSGGSAFAIAIGREQLQFAEPWKMVVPGAADDSRRDPLSAHFARR